MSNPYYNYTSGQPITLSRGSSVAIRTEYGYIQSGFDAVYVAITSQGSGLAADIATKGNIVNQVWGGVHDFTGASTLVKTMPFGSSGQAAASLDYVNSVAMNPVLPGQAGKAGRFLRTNGTTPSWAPGGELSINADGQIDYGSHLFAGNYSVTLPDLTGGTPMILSVPANATSVPASVKTSNNWSVTTGFAAGTHSTIMPLSSATPHGWWGSRSMVPPLLGQATITGGITTPTIVSSIQLSPTCIVIALNDDTISTGALVCIDPTTGNIGNQISINTNNSGTFYSSLFPIGSSGFVYTYWNITSQQSMAIACTVSGLTIVPGSATPISSNNFSGVPIQLGNTSTFLCALNSSIASSDLVAFSVAGTSITVGAPTGSGAPANSIANKLMSLSNTTALLVYPTSSSVSCPHAARVTTITGLAIGLSAPVNTGIGTLNPSNVRSTFLAPFSANSFLYAAQDNVASSNSNYFLLSVSGTTPIWSNRVVLSSVTVPYDLARNQKVTNLGRSGFSVYALGHYMYLVSATQMILLVGTGLVLAMASGGNIALGPVTPSSSNILLTDYSGANLYATVFSAGSQFQKVTISGTNVVLGSAIAAWPSVVFTDTVNDAAANYGGTWYKWTGVPVASLAIAVDKYINLNGSTLNVYGSFS